MCCRLLSFSLLFSTLISMVAFSQQVAPRAPKGLPGFKEIHYDSLSGRLDLVQEEDGTAIVHYGVPENIYKAFEKAPFKGAFYRANIQKYYRTTPTLRWGGRNMVPVASRIFDGVWYNSDTQDLILLQDGGAATQYSNVPKAVYEGFLNAPIKGAYFHGFIKEHFPSTPATPLPEGDEEPTGPPPPVSVAETSTAEKAEEVASTTEASPAPTVSEEGDLAPQADASLVIPPEASIEENIPVAEEESANDSEGKLPEGNILPKAPILSDGMLSEDNENAPNPDFEPALRVADEPHVAPPGDVAEPKAEFHPEAIPVLDLPAEPPETLPEAAPESEPLPTPEMPEEPQVAPEPEVLPSPILPPELGATPLDPPSPSEDEEIPENPPEPEEPENPILPESKVNEKNLSAEKNAAPQNPPVSPAPNTNDQYDPEVDFHFKNLKIK